MSNPIICISYVMCFSHFIFQMKKNLKIVFFFPFRLTSICSDIFIIVMSRLIFRFQLYIPKYLHSLYIYISYKIENSSWKKKIESSKWIDAKWIGYLLIKSDYSNIWVFDSRLVLTTTFVSMIETGNCVKLWSHQLVFHSFKRNFTVISPWT